MKKLLLAVLLVSRCVAGEHIVQPVALRPLHMVMLAAIVAVDANQVPFVLVDRRQAKNVQSKKYAREQKNQKFPRSKNAKGKQPRR